MTYTNEELERMKKSLGIDGSEEIEMGLPEPENPLEIIKKRLSQGLSIDEILKNEFPDMQIAVVQGSDNFSYEYYVKNAFFDEKLAKEYRSKIPRNGTGSLSDTYRILTGTIEELEKGKMPFDDADKKMIYSSLNDAISN